MLQLQTNKIIERFEKYQGLMDRDEMRELYKKLINEEMDEYHDSARNGDIVGVYDAIADIFWVHTVFVYLCFNKTTPSDIAKCDYFKISEPLMCDLLDEVIKSNFTKSLGTQEDGEKKGKVIKGPNYVKPDIESVLKKHGILQ